MNVDLTMQELEERCQFTAPATSLCRVVVDDQYLKQIQVRKKRGSQDTYSLLWCLSLGDTSTPDNRASFWGNTIIEVVKKAQKWAGIPTKTRNKRSDKNISTATPQQLVAPPPPG